MPILRLLVFRLFYLRRFFLSLFLEGFLLFFYPWVLICSFVGFFKLLCYFLLLFCTCFLYILVCLLLFLCFLWGIFDGGGLFIYLLLLLLLLLSLLLLLWWWWWWLFFTDFDTFYLLLYDVKHMVEDHSDREKGNPLPPLHGLFPISSKGSFICTIPQTGDHIPQPLLHQSWSTGWNEK